jgi:transcriptional regulator with XRE-family HTH domain
MTSESFRDRLIAARERLGLSRAEMAARLLTPRQTYEQWEAGARRTPGVALIAAEMLAVPARRWHLGIDWDAALAAGGTAPQIARRLGCDPESVRSAAKTRGITLQAAYTCPRGLDWTQIFAAAAARDESAAECARRVGCAVSTVRYMAARQQVRLRDGRGDKQRRHSVALARTRQRNERGQFSAARPILDQQWERS